MPPWQNVEGFMSLRYLDDGVGLDGTFVLGFRITDEPAEKWSARMNAFKNKDKAALFGAAACLRAGVPGLLKALGLPADRTMLIPAISSRDEVASPESFISMLATAVARSAGARFDGQAVRKKVHQPLHGIFAAAGRTAELDKADYKAEPRTGIRHFVVVDDLVTRGGTMSRMAQALKGANPGATVHGVALGKTERRGYCGPNLDNGHVDQHWEEAWLRGERKYRER